MAKQDLYKTAQQSAKLFKLINENQELEGWVSAKIAKAAADIESVYQYLNYEKQFQDYSKMIAESTDLSESKRAILSEKLMEAKAKVKELKKKAAKEKAEKMDENAFDYKDKGEMKVGDTKKTRTGELTKTKTGVIHKNTSYSDEERGEANTTHAKAKSASEKKKEAPAQKKSKTGTWGMEGGTKFDNRKKTDEGKKPLKGNQKKLDADDDGDIQADDLADLRAGRRANEGTYLGKAVSEGKKCPICKKDPCKCGKSSSPAKKRGDLKKVSEGDMGKHNNATTGFKALSKKAGKGNKEKGDKIAGAVLAKMKASGKIKEAIARAKDVLEGKGKKGDGNLANNAKPYDKVTRGDVIAGRLGKDEKGGKKETVKESTEFDRLKTLVTCLNG